VSAQASLFEIPKERLREFTLVLLDLIWEFGGNDWVAEGVLHAPKAFSERGTLAKARLVIAQDSHDFTGRWEDPAYDLTEGLVLRKQDLEVVEFKGYNGSHPQEWLPPRSTLKMMIALFRQGFLGPIFVYTIEPGRGHPPREWMKVDVDNNRLELGLFEERGGKSENLVFLLEACKVLGFKQLVPT